jgi:DNA-binding MarR family transcriptional regulator
MVRTRTTVKPGLLLQPYILFQLAGAIVDGVTEGSDVVGGEFAVASWLNASGHTTPTELARDLGLAPTTLSAIIDRLVRKGQARRIANPDDGRSYLLELTARGKATNARNSARFTEAIQQVRQHLDADEEETLEAMRRLEEALRKTLTEG